METETLVAKSIELRDRLTQLSDVFKAEKAALDEAKDTIDHELKNRLEAAGGTSLKTKAGTIMSKTTTSYKLADSGTFINWVRENGKVELLQQRLATTELKSMLDAGAELPPGVMPETTVSISIRRA